MAKTQTRPWDVVEHLETEEDKAAYLTAAHEQGDPALIAAALGDIARARMPQTARETAQDASQEVRRLWLLEEVRSRRLGFGKAAELAGVPVATFLHLMGEHHIDAFGYDDSELDRELSPMS